MVVFSKKNLTEQKERVASWKWPATAGIGTFLVSLTAFSSTAAAITLAFGVSVGAGAIKLLVPAKQSIEKEAVEKTFKAPPRTKRRVFTGASEPQSASTSNAGDDQKPKKQEEESVVFQFGPPQTTVEATLDEVRAKAYVLLDRLERISPLPNSPSEGNALAKASELLDKQGSHSEVLNVLENLRRDWSNNYVTANKKIGDQPLLAPSTFYGDEFVRTTFSTEAREILCDTLYNSKQSPVDRPAVLVRHFDRDQVPHGILPESHLGQRDPVPLRIPRTGHQGSKHL